MARQAVSEVVSVKLFHPGVCRFVTQEEFDALQKEYNSPASIARQLEEAEQYLAQKIVEKEQPKEVHRPKSVYAGKALFPKVKANPRKPGSKGQAAFQIILDHPGITYEEYIKQGGGNNHLAWDIDHDKVEVK